MPAGTLRLPWLRFFHAFSSVVRQMPGYNSQRRGTARALLLFLNFCVVLCIVCFVSFCVLFVCKCVPYYCHRLATQLQLTNISYHIYQFKPLTLDLICQMTLTFRTHNRSSSYAINWAAETPWLLSVWSYDLLTRLKLGRGMSWFLQVQHSVKMVTIIDVPASEH